MCHKKNSEQFMVVFKTDSNVYQSLFDNIFKKKKMSKVMKDYLKIRYFLIFCAYYYFLFEENISGR